MNLKLYANIIVEYKIVLMGENQNRSLSYVLKLSENLATDLSWIKVRNSLFISVNISSVPITTFK